MGQPARATRNASEAQHAEDQCPVPFYRTIVICSQARPRWIRRRPARQRVYLPSMRVARQEEEHTHQLPLRSALDALCATIHRECCAQETLERQRAITP